MEYIKEDLDKMLILFRHTGGLSVEQQDFIYLMLKRYIDKDHYRPIANCQCAMGYGEAFIKLRDFVSINGNKFNVEKDDRRENEKVKRTNSKNKN